MFFVKRIIVLLLLLGFCLGLTACGRGESDAMAAAEPTELSVKSTLDSRERLRYAAEQISLPEGQRIDLVSGLVPLEGRVYFSASRGEQSLLCSVAPDGSDYQVLLPNVRQIWQLSADGGKLYALVDLGDENESHYCLAELSTAGETLRSIALSPEGAPTGWLPYRVEVSGGLVYALGTDAGGRSSLCVLEGETLLYSLSCGSASLVKLSDGKVLLGRSGEGVFQLQEIDAGEKTLRGFLTLDLPLRYVGGDESSLYFSYQGSLLRMNPDFSGAEKVLTFARAGIAERVLLPAGEDCFLCVDQEGRLFRLRPAGELGKEDGTCVLTIAVNAEFSVYPLDQYVLEWNRTHPDCIVEIKNYYVPTGVEGDPAGYEKGMDALVMDITTGNIPDLYLLGRDMDPMLLTRKGYLEDLYPYMDADAEMGPV